MQYQHNSAVVIYAHNAEDSMLDCRLGVIWCENLITPIIRRCMEDATICFIDEMKCAGMLNSI
eukprot:1156568-Pelagomonas_calceolata.AAC.2